MEADQSDPDRCAVSGALLDKLRECTTSVVGPWREPEIPVTDEMIAAGNKASDNEPICGDPDDGSNQWFRAIYRAMAALAPVELVSAAEDRIAALEAESDPGGCLRIELHALKAETDRERRDLRTRIAVLEAERLEWAAVNGNLLREVSALQARLTTFGEDNIAGRDESADLPDAPRRPDGTLAPQAKPLPVLKRVDPSRRVGG